MLSERVHDSLISKAELIGFSLPSLGSDRSSSIADASDGKTRTKDCYSGGNGNRGEIGFAYFSKTLAMTAK